MNIKRGVVFLMVLTIEVLALPGTLIAAEADTGVDIKEVKIIGDLQNALMFENDPQKAVRLADDYLGQFSTYTAEVMLLKSDAFARLNDYNNAITILKDLSQKETGTWFELDAGKRLARIMVSTGDLSGAENYLSQIIGKSTDMENQEIKNFKDSLSDTGTLPAEEEKLIRQPFRDLRYESLKMLLGIYEKQGNSAKISETNNRIMEEFGSEK